MRAIHLEKHRQIGSREVNSLVQVFSLSITSRLPSFHFRSLMQALMNSISSSSYMRFTFNLNFYEQIIIFFGF